MAAVAILKNQKMAKSHQGFDRSPQNLVHWCTLSAIKSQTFENPRWRTAVSSKVERSQYLDNGLPDVQNLAQWHILTLQTRSAVKIKLREANITNPNPQPTLSIHLETLCPCIINYQYPHGSCLPVPARDTLPPCWRCCKYVSHVRLEYVRQ